MKLDKSISRRKFLGQALAATAAFAIVPRHVLGGKGHTPPSETTTHAIIGDDEANRLADQPMRAPWHL